jgi:hypothetical protein
METIALNPDLLVRLAHLRVINGRRVVRARLYALDDNGEPVVTTAKEPR